MWRGWGAGALLATVERRGGGWGVTLHRDGEDERIDAVYTTHEGAQRKAEHLLYG